MLILRIILCCVSVFLVSCGKSPSQPTSTQSDPNTARDEIRIAAMSPAMSVMIRDLGYEDRIVAKHDYDMILGSRVPAAGSELGFDLEMLIQTNPTHVLFQKTSTERSQRFLQIAQEHHWIIFERPLNTLDDIATTMDDLYFLFNGVPQRQDRQYDMNEVFSQPLPSAKLAAAWDDLGPVADAAGRVLVLASVDPIGAMGPGSYHHQIIDRLGASQAITEGSMWIELDYEDLIRLNPDSIVLIAPRQPSEDERFAEPLGPTPDDIKRIFGPIMELPINAVTNGHIGVIDHPLGLLPSGSLGEVAEEIGALFQQWDQ
tara:strand:+ start:187295 stop:188242 length:948 start_codon:yes stop_codon:yes gene_type:complete